MVDAQLATESEVLVGSRTVGVVGAGFDVGGLAYGKEGGQVIMEGRCPAGACFTAELRMW
jgi:hypothetical protein